MAVRATAISPTVWNIGASHSIAEAAVTWPTAEKFTAPKKPLIRVITAPLGFPVVPEV